MFVNKRNDGRSYDLNYAENIYQNMPETELVSRSTKLFNKTFYGSFGANTSLNSTKNDRKNRRNRPISATNIYTPYAVTKRYVLK